MLNPPMDVRQMIVDAIARHDARAARTDLPEEHIRIARFNAQDARNALARLDARR